VLGRRILDITNQSKVPARLKVPSERPADGSHDRCRTDLPIATYILLVCATQKDYKWYYAVVTM
jgi:hypothetical protein